MGPDLANLLRKDIPIDVIASGTVDKVTRAAPFLNMLDKGLVYLPKGENSWRPVLESEWLSWQGLDNETNDIIDCVEGANVRLTKDGRKVAETTSDNYGDFKFDKLDENSGHYLIEISASGHANKTVEATLGVSINLGEIRL